MAKGPKPRPFWDQVGIGEPHECWPWTGRCDKDGYGGISRSVDGIRYQRAHRLAYRLHHGAAPGPLLVMHTCDNPPCCNPAHLRLGTVAENNADMVAKNRARYPLRENHWARRMPERVPRGDRHYAHGGMPERRGAGHPNVKLTDGQVREIRQRYAAGGVYQRELAEEYGVSKGHVNAIILRRFRPYVD